MTTDGREPLFGVLGRLQGLAGTTRYEIPLALRDELREIGNQLARALGAEDFVVPPFSS